MPGSGTTLEQVHVEGARGACPAVCGQQNAHQLQEGSAVVIGELRCMSQHAPGLSDSLWSTMRRSDGGAFLAEARETDGDSLHLI